MGVQPLTVAVVAAALLVVSVGADLAFNQRVSLEASVGDGPRQLVGEGPLDGRFSRPVAQPDAFEANESDTLLLHVKLHNDHPWGSTRTFTFTRDGCYEGATVLAVVDVTAGARGVGTATTEISIARLLGPDTRFEPKPVDTPATSGTQYAFLQMCRGERYVLSASIPITEVAK